MRTWVWSYLDLVRIDFYLFYDVAVTGIVKKSGSATDGVAESLTQYVSKRLRFPAGY